MVLFQAMMQAITLISIALWQPKRKMDPYLFAVSAQMADGAQGQIAAVFAFVSG